jgi:hypothetical protein
MAGRQTGPVFDKLLVLLGLLGPAIASALGASRRSRLVTRARAYSELADKIEAHDPDGAAAVRQLVAELTERVVAQERASLGRRIEVAGVVAWALFIAPAAIGSYFAWTRPGPWTWPVLLVSVAWAVLCTAAAWGEVVKVPEPPASPEPRAALPGA